MKRYLLLLLLLSSCISVRVGGLDNDYSKLTPQQRGSIGKFSFEQRDVVRDQSKTLYVAEITALQIRNCLPLYAYTLVYLWDVNCKGNNCKPLFYYERIEKKFRDRGLKMFVVSEGYQYDLIKGNAERSAYDRELYVLSDSVYGHRLQHSRRQFLGELAGGEGGREYGNRYAFFKGTKMIYRGLSISEEIVDSLMKLN